MVKRILLAVLVSCAAPTFAATLSVTPDYQKITNSGVVSVRVDGLNENRLGGYDFFVTWDPAIVSLTSVLFAAPGEFDGLGQWELLDLGLASVRAVFFADPEDLVASQPEGFVLADLTFAGVGSGISLVDLEISELTDAFAQPFGAEVANGAIEVVPEPSTVWLIAGGALVAANRVLRRGFRR
ncbi:MAG: PEP-CTERM sorting domain-containing protein [Bryobacteraceae bacterium]|nr:PEP-CTERM sorting domain-containing protein [Bryobacteraceae bacterium]